MLDNTGPEEMLFSDFHLKNWEVMIKKKLFAIKLLQIKCYLQLQFSKIDELSYSF